MMKIFVWFTKRGERKMCIFTFMSLEKLNRNIVYGVHFRNFMI